MSKITKEAEGITLSYSMEAYEILYQEPTGEMAFEELRHKIKNWGVKSIWSGEVGKSEFAEAVVYPKLIRMEDIKKAKEAKERAKSTPAQQKLNDKNSELKFDRLLNTNFHPWDIIGGLPYRRDNQPIDDDMAERDVVKFMRRMSYLRKTKGMPELKYAYTTEKVIEGGNVYYHHHIIINGDGITWEDVQEKWLYGDIYRKRFTKREKREGVLTATARYMLEDKTNRLRPQEKVGKRRWKASLNLKKPVETVSDKRLSKKDVRIISKAATEEAADVFEKAYPNYELLFCEVRWSRFAPGPYIYARMRRREKSESKRIAGTIGKRGAAMPISMGSL